MQGYRRYGAPYSTISSSSSSSSPSSAPVEEVSAEEEVFEEEEEAEEERQFVVQEAGGDVEEEEGKIEQIKREVLSAVSDKETIPSSEEVKNGKKRESRGADSAAARPGGGIPKSSVFTWFVVLALLGVWSSVAVLYFDIVDYDRVIARAQEFHMNFSDVLQGKLKAYDSDGDGDFDIEDAKVLLGLTKDGSDSTGHTESLEDVVSILAEEGSDWIFGFFTFLYDVVSSPVEQHKEKESGNKGGMASQNNEEVQDPKLDL